MAKYVGLDVSKEETSYCVMDSAGTVLSHGKVLSDPQSLFDVLRAQTLCRERIVLETGTLSNWLARGLREYGLPVDMIDARQAPAVMKLQHNKTDANDAELLATITRTGFCRPVAVNSEAAQKVRILIKAAPSGLSTGGYLECHARLPRHPRSSLSQGDGKAGRAGRRGLGGAA